MILTGKALLMLAFEERAAASVGGDLGVWGLATNKRQTGHRARFALPSSSDALLFRRI